MLVKMGLTDTHAGLILPMAAGGCRLIFIFRAFFSRSPRVDGRGKGRWLSELMAFLTSLSHFACYRYGRHSEFVSA